MESKDSQDKMPSLDTEETRALLQGKGIAPLPEGPRGGKALLYVLPKRHRRFKDESGKAIPVSEIASVARIQGAGEIKFRPSNFGPSRMICEISKDGGLKVDYYAINRVTLEARVVGTSYPKKKNAPFYANATDLFEAADELFQESDKTPRP